MRAWELWLKWCWCRVVGHDPTVSFGALFENTWNGGTRADMFCQRCWRDL